MRDEDASSVLSALNPTVRSLEIVHRNEQQLGVPLANELSNLLVREDSPLLNLRVRVQLIGHQALFVLAEALQNTNSLNVFEIEGLQFDEGSCAVLQEGLQSNSSITTLELSGCVIPADQADFLRNIFIGNTTIHHLVLSECSGNLSPRFVEAIPQLTTLSVSGHLVDGAQELSASDLSVLADALVQSPYLRSLNLSRNNVSDKGVSMIARALHHNTNLTNLDLSLNAITDKGCRALASMLKTNSRLKRLGLEWNPITAKGVRNVFSVLQDNNSLEEVKISILREDETWAGLMPFILAMRQTNFALTMSSMVSDQKLSSVIERGSDPEEVLEFAKFLLRNRHNQKQRKESLVELLYDALDVSNISMDSSSQAASSSGHAASSSSVS